MFSIGFCNLLDVKIDCNHAYVTLLLSNLFFPPLISLFSHILLVFTVISLQTMTHKSETALSAKLAGHSALQ